MNYICVISLYSNMYSNTLLSIIHITLFVYQIYLYRYIYTYENKIYIFQYYFYNGQIN